MDEHMLGRIRSAVVRQIANHIAAPRHEDTDPFEVWEEYQVAQDGWEEVISGLPISDQEAISALIEETGEAPPAEVRAIYQEEEFKAFGKSVDGEI